MKNILLCISIAVIVACSSLNYKPTAYPYQIDQAAIKKQPINNVMVASINAGKPSRHYLQRHESFVDTRLSEYLEQHDIRLSSSRLFDFYWGKYKNQYGNLTSAGRVTAGFKKAKQATLDDIFTQYPKLDAVIFTDLLETPVRYSNQDNRTAQWHGVMRQVKVEGIGEGFTTDFNWMKDVSGISIMVTIVNRQQEQVFQSIGGIQIAEALKIQNKSASFSRRHDLLRSNKEIDEGVKLALHPFIYWDGHPGFASDNARQEK